MGLYDPVNMTFYNAKGTLTGSWKPNQNKYDLPPNVDTLVIATRLVKDRSQHGALGDPYKSNPNYNYEYYSTIAPKEYFDGPKTYYLEHFKAGHGGVGGAPGFATDLPGLVAATGTFNYQLERNESIRADQYMRARAIKAQVPIRFLKAKDYDFPLTHSYRFYGSMSSSEDKRGTWD